MIRLIDVSTKRSTKKIVEHFISLTKPYFDIEFFF